jgi:hypothetical protein
MMAVKVSLGFCEQGQLSQTAQTPNMLTTGSLLHKRGA